MQSPISVALIALLTLSTAHAQRLAVYQSETNAQEYHGIYQEPLRRWLTQRGEEFEVVGDEAAAEAPTLSGYAVVLASSTYLVPEAAAKGLREYVAKGGRLLWIDSPARCTEPGLWAALGLDPGVSYAPLSDCTLRAKVPKHPASISMLNASLKNVVGNFATRPRAEALVLYDLEGTVENGQRATYPAVIVARSGKGVGMCVNWVVWQTRESEVRQVLDDALDWLLADSRLAEQPVVAFTSLARPNVRQPAPLSVGCKAFRRVGTGKGLASCTVSLHAAGGKEARATATASLQWTHTDGEVEAGAATMEFNSAELPDGSYEVAASLETDGRRAVAAPVTVTLDGQLQTRLREEQAARKELLTPLLTGTLGDYDAEPRTPEGRVDLPRLLAQLETAHMNMYDFLIWHAPTDWEDFRRFLPLAKARGLKVWVTLCPPSEQGDGYPWSEPFRLDFLKWADEIGKLSKQYDNLVALVIDDFWSGGNHGLFTPEYIGKLVSTLRSHNPNLAFLPTVYWGTIGDQQWIEDYGPLVDGIVFPYAELETGDDLADQLKTCREWLGPHKFLLMNVYASGSSGPAERGPRTGDYMRKVLTRSRQMCDGVRIYCLPKDKLLDDYRYAITAELYGKWRAEGKAGK